jgi:hypothetical protein
MLPYLFIEGFNASNPVIQSGTPPTTFVWDEKLRVHIKRFASIEEFQREAAGIVRRERYWDILPGVEDPQPAAAPPAASSTETEAIGEAPLPLPAKCPEPTAKPAPPKAKAAKAPKSAKAAKKKE